MIFIPFPLIICSFLDFLLNVCIVLERKKNKCFSIRLSLELIIFALEALTDPMAPGYLDSHSGCALLQEQRGGENPELEKPDGGVFADARRQLEWPLIYC